MVCVIFCNLMYWLLVVVDVKVVVLVVVVVATMAGIFDVVAMICIQLFANRSKSKRRCATCVSSCRTMKMNTLPFAITLVPYTRLLRLMCMRLKVSAYAIHTRENTKNKKSNCIRHTLLYVATFCAVFYLSVARLKSKSRDYF